MIEIQHWTGFGARVRAPRRSSVDWKLSAEPGSRRARVPVVKRDISTSSEDIGKYLFKQYGNGRSASRWDLGKHSIDRMVAYTT
ncbi:hypothetical protein FCM35_KLT10228 [Carex littledalei]|uniref:Uncharacterized protein n=1 Tax=Carex littledalei TaxID=544730 RepID=A0A833QSU9_9POAL|nr:hypothetical protein FCM35_KLT10228 [Carex littledalei]